MSALVIGRDSVVRDLLAVILKNNGVKVIEAHTLDEALPLTGADLRAAFVDTRPQVFWETAQLPELKERLGDARLVLVQDADSPSDLEDALSVDADAMIMVPFVRSTVIDVFNRLVACGSVAGERRAAG